MRSRPSSHHQPRRLREKLVRKRDFHGLLSEPVRNLMITIAMHAYQFERPSHSVMSCASRVRLHAILVKETNC